jgi:hypothetical protein
MWWTRSVKDVVDFHMSNSRCNSDATPEIGTVFFSVSSRPAVGRRLRRRLGQAGRGLRPRCRTGPSDPAWRSGPSAPLPHGSFGSRVASELVKEMLTR